MVSVILIWIYILITTFGLGIVLMLMARRLLGYQCVSPLAVILAGLTGATVYSQVFSLFSGVGLIANVVFLISIVAMLVVLRHKLKSVISQMAITKGQIIVGIVIFLLMAYGTSHGIMHYDTGLYHAQAIRWIEEYGVVPGLGNLHGRLGYNSAAFPVTALYSMSFLAGRSFHTVSGFCSLLLAWEIMGVAKSVKTKTLSASLFARFMALYYLLIIFDEMVSPASDYYMVTLAFIFFIRILDILEEEKDKENIPVRIAMLAFLACLILTIKLSGGLLILCAIIPAVFFCREKQVKRIVVCLITGITIVIPYLVRNVIISGWLLYPSTALDIFNVDWKIAKGLAEYDFKEIQVYGRGFTDVTKYDLPITYWFKDWLASQSALDKFFICSAIVGVVYFVVKCLYYGFSLCFRKKKAGVGLELFVEALIILSFLFWLTTSPLMRYGCLYVYLVDAIIWGSVVVSVSKKRNIYWGVMAFLALILTYKSVMFSREIVTGFRTDCFVLQQDYTEYEVAEYLVDGVTIYAPISGDQTGYTPFPSSPWEMNISLRGESIKDGFIANP